MKSAITLSGFDEVYLYNLNLEPFISDDKPDFGLVIASPYGTINYFSIDKVIVDFKFTIQTNIFQI
jgi:hypothetical protein